MFDIYKLPKKYTFNNKEALLDGVYIDDNSLFTYFCISRGLFSIERDFQAGFIFLQPFEWISVDFISFLLSVANNYGLKISKIGTFMGAVEDDYEISHEPRKYKGAYRWILELQEKEPKREEVLLYNKFLEEKASVSDLERALVYADRTAPQYKGGETSEPYLSKSLFRAILNYTHFSVTLSHTQSKNLKEDINTYLELFIEEKLERNSESKVIGNAHINQSQNIRTFKKQSQMLRKYLEEMEDNYGNAFTIENIFEEKFPNLEYPDEEFIRKRYEKRNFFFVHTLLAFEKQGLLRIRLLASNWTMHEDSRLTYRAQVELLPAFLNKDESIKLHFDKDKALFYVQGIKIKLKKNGDEYDVLRVMFADPIELPKEWQFSEIAELIDEMSTNDKKYYNAVYQLGIKLEKQGIVDFFIRTRKSVQINKQYLS